MIVKGVNCDGPYVCVALRYLVVTKNDPHVRLSFSPCVGSRVARIGRAPFSVGMS